MTSFKTQEQHNEQANDIHFDDLIEDYKSDNFKTLSLVNTKFLYFCVHPHDVN